MTADYRPPSTELADRDRRIVQVIARYGQASSKQIKQLFFTDVSSTPVDRALRRLVAGHYLIRIERRIVGGARGGSGQYVYSLGRRGFFMFFTGRFTPARTIRYHSLAIVDCVVTLKQAERAGRLSVVGLSSEPDCWVTIGRDELKPDLYVELVRGDRHLAYGSRSIWAPKTKASCGASWSGTSGHMSCLRARHCRYSLWCCGLPLTPNGRLS